MFECTSQFSLALMFVLFAIIFFGLGFPPSNGIKTYAMEEECGQEVSMIFDTVYQGHLVLTPRPSTPGITPGPCVVTIEAWYSMPYIMFYFTHLNVSCSHGNIRVVDGRGTGDYVVGLSDPICGTGPADMPPAIYTTQSQYLRITYNRLTQVEQTKILEIVFTAYSKEESCRNDQYQCSNDRCIHEGLKCNGHNPCGDQSDCRRTLSSVTIAGIVAASLVGICILVAIVTMIVYHMYCKKKLQNHESNSRMEYDNNTGRISHHHKVPSHEQTTMSIVSGQQPMYPRHWSYTDHQCYSNNNNNNNNSGINNYPGPPANTNFHYWFPTDGNHNGSNNDVRDLSRDVNATYENSSTSRPLDALNTSNDVGTDREHARNTTHISEDGNEVIFFDDDIVMDEDLGQFENTRTDGPTHNSVIDNYDNAAPSRATDHVWGDIDDDMMNNSVTPERSTSNDSTEDMEKYCKLRRFDTHSDGDDDIDRTFEHFYRDLIPDGYYDDMLVLDGSSARGGNQRRGLGSAPLTGESAHDNHGFSTDL